ncbi:hypothetical protein PAPHI01_0510 [Pancytospora philotis]|nr:hypothetical protein PAPHI01_0510 [Pancytospora philotis]
MEDTAVSRTEFVKILFEMLTKTKVTGAMHVVVLVLNIYHMYHGLCVVAYTGEILSHASQGRLSKDELSEFGLGIARACVLVTLSWFARTFLISAVQQRSEITKFIKYLRMPYEHFVAADRNENYRRLQRLCESLSKALEVLIFEFALSCAGALLCYLKIVALGDFIPGVYASLAFVLFLVAQLPLVGLLMDYKAASVANEDAMVAEMAAAHRNEHLMRRNGYRNTEEADALANRTDKLKYNMGYDLFNYELRIGTFIVFFCLLYKSSVANEKAVTLLLTCAEMSQSVIAVFSSLLRLDAFRLEQNKELHTEDTGVLRSQFVFRNSLRLTDVSIFIRARPVLRNVTLEFKNNEAVALVGPNGAGKTVFLKYLIGLFHFRGSVAVGDDSISTGAVPMLMTGLSSSISYCTNTLKPRDREGWLPGPPSKHKALESAIDKILRSFTGRHYSRIINGAGGQTETQLTNLAKTLVRDRRILFFDEPISHVPEEIKASVLSTILGYRKNRLLLVVTHECDGLALFDRIALFHDETISMYDSFRDYQRRASAPKAVK